MDQKTYPKNPILCRVQRDGRDESVHRGAWCLSDPSGEIVAGQGSFGSAFFARSAVKSMQVLPLLETGCAERFGFDDAELALAIASHSGELCHTEKVRGTLKKLGLGPEHLLCGIHPPNDPKTRQGLVKEGRRPDPVHNNCSGKHAGFLALARHLGVEPESYLDPNSESQILVREALAEMCSLEAESLSLIHI